MNTALALIPQVTRSPVAGDLKDVFKEYLPKSFFDGMRLRQELAIQSIHSRINVGELFSLATAWQQSKIDYSLWPALAIAPMMDVYATFKAKRSLARFLCGFFRGSIPISLIPQRREQYGVCRSPLVPRSVAPTNLVTRRSCYILFDSPVESWNKLSSIPEDPYLLQRLDATNFKILEHWDVTPKERELMALLAKR